MLDDEEVQARQAVGGREVEVEAMAAQVVVPVIESFHQTRAATVGGLAALLGAISLEDEVPSRLATFSACECGLYGLEQVMQTIMSSTHDEERREQTAKHH